MSLNKVMLIGNVGKDPDIRNLESGAVVANFTLATTERYKDKNGNWQDQTEWHNIVCWRALAERVEKYVRKGTQLFVEGKIRTREWMDQSEQKRYTVEILADSIQLLGKRSDSPGIQQTRAQDVQKPAYQAEEAQDEEPDDLPF
ncbi:MAG: single-stranded DNA-binding protein [Bacteroidales bacterium]|nr:single-stranded DNA-binding protein [Bacteroidales bacterium]MDD2425993.1 single-stranded DNA-binding protein [Bacteroidales bacterium]MDD3989026.1 single-stranded DNA-binding protein [Bacteroidales bacterium]MDD4638638.1 single-stranded DNA-binding protein [Bacteroidales bacterium]